MIRRLKFLIFLLIFFLFLDRNIALAGKLLDRVNQFPAWDQKPPTQVAQGDLIYPDWIAGEWQVTSTLVEMVAPLAPEIVTPGFAGNRKYLDQPIQFNVRFQPNQTLKSNQFLPKIVINASQEIVADRAFNGLNIAQATLGKAAIRGVKVDPNNPNRQIVTLRGKQKTSEDPQLISTVTQRASETPETDQFIATEIVQQIFQGESTIYLNEVETTTAYQAEFNKTTDPQHPSVITANQITAIYLSPQDPNYFKTQFRPVALYRYQLTLLPFSASPRS